MRFVAAALGTLACVVWSACDMRAPERQGTDLYKEIELPVRYLADRFAVLPVTESGDTLELYTDTGGGASRLWPETVTQLGLQMEQEVVGGDTINVVFLPQFAPDAAIPLPNEPEPIGQRLIVTEVGRRFGRDGFLGRMWFADRAWVFDYPNRSLALLPDGFESAAARRSHVQLGFRTDSSGVRTGQFPRIRIEIDGDSLDLLFDTGATVHLTETALAALAEMGMSGSADRGASFIAQTVFEEWRAQHPNWRVIDAAGLAFETEWPMIEVPSVSVAGHEAGPVWFTMRSNQSFQGMSTATDLPVVGALGGSALKYFRITVDYPNATAIFEQPTSGN